MDAGQDYWAALEEADRGRAQQTVNALLEAGWDSHRVLDELVVPSQERAGELWLCGEWVVAQEHMATGVNEAIVHWLISRLPPPSPDADVALVSCLRGDQHALPALVVAHGLTARGFRVVYVGADPEQSGLLVLVLRLRPRVVLFSASLTSSLSAQKTLFQNIAAVGIPVIVGGRAFGGRELGARRAQALGATAYAETVDEVVALLAPLPARTRPPEAAASGVGDEDAMWLHSYRSEIAPDVMRVLAGRHVGTRSVGESWPELADHVEHVLGCLAAAIMTEDATIVTEVRNWLVSLLQHRGVDTALVDEVWDLLADRMRGHPVARAFLASSRPTGEVPGPVAT